MECWRVQASGSESTCKETFASVNFREHRQTSRAIRGLESVKSVADDSQNAKGLNALKTLQVSSVSALVCALFPFNEKRPLLLVPQIYRDGLRDARSNNCVGGLHCTKGISQRVGHTDPLAVAVGKRTPVHFPEVPHHTCRRCCRCADVSLVSYRLQNEWRLWRRWWDRRGDDPPIYAQTEVSERVQSDCIRYWLMERCFCSSWQQGAPLEAFLGCLAAGGNPF